MSIPYHILLSNFSHMISKFLHTNPGLMCLGGAYSPERSQISSNAHPTAALIAPTCSVRCGLRQIRFGAGASPTSCAPFPDLIRTIFPGTVFINLNFKRIFSVRSTWGLASCVAKPTQACLSPCAALRVQNKYSYS